MQKISNLSEKNIHIGKNTIIEEDVELGDGVWIGNFVHIRYNVRIGNWSHIRNWTFVEPDVTIGHNTRIMQYCNITAGASIGNECFFAPGVILLNDRKIAWPNTKDFIREAPVIEDKVKIGGNATILPGVRLCEGCVIGAGSLVAHNTQPWTVYVGNPARPLKKIDRLAL